MPRSGGAMVIPLLLGTNLLLAGQAIAGAQTSAPPAPASTPAVTCEAKNTEPQTAISFDTKGVEFGPWVRRFVQRVRRNWFVPAEAFASKGCATHTVRVRKDGKVAEVVTLNPSGVPAFTEAGYKALIATSFEPLPAAYPDDSVTITVTFYYNQSLPSNAPSVPTLTSESLSNTAQPPPPAPDLASQPEPTAPPTRAVGHSAVFKLTGSGPADAIDLLRWFATGKAGATGLWLVEHHHADAPGSPYCRGSLALVGERLVFRSENLSEGFVAVASEITTVNRQQDAKTFTISFK